MPADFFAASPADDPLSYPGAIPDFSYVLTGHRHLVRLQPRKDRPLRQGLVDVKELTGNPARTSLHELLLTNSAAPVDERVPVLAIGSNAAPAQLARKLNAANESPVVPVVEATTTGLRVLPSAHINRAGYLPWAPYHSSRAAALPVFVTLLDARQLACVDQAEPNYARVPLVPTSHLVRLAGSGEPLDGCHVYASNHGVITDGRVLSSNRAPAQQLLLGRLLAYLPELADLGIVTVASFVAAIRQHRLDAEYVTALIKHHLRVEPPRRLPCSPR